MKYHDQLLKDIDATYPPRYVNNRPENHYEVLCAKHKVLIDSIKDELVSVVDELPQICTRVLAVEDLSPLGRGVFLGDYWYNKHGFASDECSDDTYGFITHWAYLRLEND